MARVNVEQKALTDPRFVTLGLLVDADAKCARATGLFLMILVWNECQERGVYTLETADVCSLAHGSGLNIDGPVGAAGAIVEAGLAEWKDDDCQRLRIKGTKGRTDWLKKRRMDGKKGGRPRNPRVSPDDDGRSNPRGSRPNNPPAPAPAPAHKSRNFTPPSVDEVNSYCRERGNAIDGQAFVDHYEAKGWMIGKSKMKNWRAAVRTWEKNAATKTPRVLTTDEIAHGILDPTTGHVEMNAKTCRRPDCERPECVAARRAGAP